MMQALRRLKSFAILSPALIFMLVYSGLSPLSASGAQTVTLEGKVLDIKGKAVEGAEVFIYDNSDTRRTADYLSLKTDKEGRFKIILPAGKYWAVARLKKGGLRYGPLAPGDKHSGEPVEINLPSGEHRMNFIVADLREAASMSGKKIREDYIKIKGRITDKHGAPVKTTYAIANKNKEFSVVPDYISTWTDENGYYILYVPRGKYYVGYASAFPPGKNYNFNREMVFTDSITDLDIVIDNTGTNKGKE